ncbi:hypothetical protein [Virgibacillus doumboii]|uniref:hypothetical protein n=1 Tax=Virgibacillus doumboii TaxID=2697503 RepID=UPI0013DFB1BF|nr:hypothetical protein [Virgibacillus doumboii]
MVFLLAIFGIILLMLLLSAFIKKRTTLIIVTVSIIFGTIFLVDQMKYTTFTELYSDEINDDSILEKATLTVYERADDHFPKRKAELEIEDKEIMEDLFQDFSKLELKKDENLDDPFRIYSIRFVSTNKIKENTYESEFVTLDLNSNYLENYEIVSDTDHLKTIGSLVENEELDWKYY